jgi:hypothetical protein
MRDLVVDHRMTANPQKFGASPAQSPDLVHEMNYAIEVLQKEYPKLSHERIKRTLESVRIAASPASDRWQILQLTRNKLSAQ